MTITQYDKVRLKDGRTGIIVEIFKEGTAYIVDVDLPGPDWNPLSIQHEDIDEIIK